MRIDFTVTETRVFTYSDTWGEEITPFVTLDGFVTMIEVTESDGEQRVYGTGDKITGDDLVAVRHAAERLNIFIHDGDEYVIRGHA